MPSLEEDGIGSQEKLNDTLALLWFLSNTRARMTLTSNMSGLLMIRPSPLLLRGSSGTAIVHFIDIHHEMQYNCTLHNIRDKSVQGGIV